MPSGQLAPVLRFLRALGRGLGDVADRDLLHRFAARRDGDAFAALMQRHGPMVLAVCRRVLPDADAAEDAFQAAFLVLARKAASVGRPERLGSWLYGVAYRTALKAKATAGRRQARLAPLPDDLAAPTPEPGAPDLRAVLDDEVSRLPDRYRAPFVLCYLEGHTNEEAARLLGCPKGTVLSRLATARQRLRSRLTRRGLAPSGALLAAVAAPAAVRAEMTGPVVQAALLFASGRAVPGVVSAEAVALAEGVLRTMFQTKLKLTALVVLTACCLLAGSGALVLRAHSATVPGAGHNNWLLPLPEKPAEVTVDDAGADDRKVIEASGKPETRKFDLAGFTTVEISSVFDVTITRGDAFGVSVTADDNLLPLVRAVKDGKALKLSLDTKGVRVHGGKWKATITMPELEGLSLAGACRAALQGFKSDKAAKVKVAGASKLDGELQAGRVDLDASGASSVRLKGSAKEMKLAAAGASHVNLTDFAVEAADVQLSGASSAKLRVSAKLDYRLSGASHLAYQGDPAVGKKETSGASSAKRQPAGKE